MACWLLCFSPSIFCCSSRGALRGYLFIFDSLLELRVEVDVVQKQINLYRKRRKLLLQSFPDGLSDAFAVGRNLDTLVFHGFVFEILNNPRFDQDTEKLGPTVR